MGFCELEVATGKVSEIRREKKRYGSLPRFHVDVARLSGVILFRTADATSPVAVYLADSNFTSVRRLPLPNDWLSKFDLGRTEMVEWTYREQTRRGLLLLPGDGSNTTPCIVCVYPGSRRSSQAADFRLSLTIGDAADANPRFFFSAASQYLFLTCRLPKESRCKTFGDRLSRRSKRLRKRKWSTRIGWDCLDTAMEATR